VPRRAARQEEPRFRHSCHSVPPPLCFMQQVSSMVEFSEVSHRSVMSYPSCRTCLEQSRRLKRVRLSGMRNTLLTREAKRPVLSSKAAAHAERSSNPASKDAISPVFYFCFHFCRKTNKCKDFALLPRFSKESALSYIKSLERTFENLDQVNQASLSLARSLPLSPNTHHRPREPRPRAHML
jgi:hypothetical protein